MHDHLEKIIYHSIKVCKNQKKGSLKNMFDKTTKSKTKGVKTVTNKVKQR